MEISGLVNFDEEYEIPLKYVIGIKKSSPNSIYPDYSDKKRNSIEITIPWKKIFMLLADDFLYEKSEGAIQRNFADSLSKHIKIDDGFTLISKSISTKCIKAIFTQLMAYGLIDYHVSEKSKYLKWFLTKKGQKSMLENRAILKGET